MTAQYSQEKQSCLEVKKAAEKYSGAFFSTFILKMYNEVCSLKITQTG